VLIAYQIKRWREALTPQAKGCDASVGYQREKERDGVGGAWRNLRMEREREREREQFKRGPFLVLSPKRRVS
jgi:hypothetical protein